MTHPDLHPDLQTLLSRAQAHEPAARYDEALQDLQTVLARARQEGLASFEAAALHHSARILRIKGELVAAEEYAREAAGVYARLSDLVGLAHALMVQAEVYSDQAKFREFEAMCRQAMALGEQADSPSVQGRALTLLGTSEILQGKAREAREHIEQGAAAYQRSGDRRGTATSLLMLGRVDHMNGRLGAAARSVETAIAMFEEQGETRATVSAAFSLGQIDLERGALEDGRRFADRGLTLTRGSGDVVMQLRCMLLRSQVDLEAGAPGSALETMREADALCSRYDLASILPEIYRTMAQAQLASGEPALGEASAARAIAAAAEDDDYSQGTAELVHALSMAALGRGEAAAAFIRGLEHLEKAGETYEIGWGQLAYGQYLLGQGERTAAGEHLRRAREVFAGLEARAKVAVIDRLLA